MRLVSCGVLVAIGGVAALGGWTPEPRSYEAAPAAAADRLGTKFRGELAEVIARAEQRELIPVSIVMRDQASPADVMAARSIEDKSQRRGFVISTLKDVAHRSQGGVLAVLRAEQAAGNVGRSIVPLWIHNVVGATVTPAVARLLAARDDVAYLNWDRPIGEEALPVEPFDPKDVISGATAAIECGVNVMGAPLVWSDLGITGAGVVVGVIDTGCCITHPDLANQIWTNPGEIPGNNIDDDGNGFVDDIHGWSFDNNGSSPNINDSNGHGTHVSGTVAGDGTNGTTTGMAPNAEIMTLKFWNSFSGELSVWNGTEYGVENGADVLTASLGWPHSVGPDRPTWRAVVENAMAAGVVVIYAAGNEGACCGVDSVRTPGDVPDMITVGATDCNHNIAGFSSRGPVTWQNVPPYNDWPHPPGKLKPTIAAPGVDTISTSNNCSGYISLSGTSMATPHVAGAVALILEANPNLDHWEVKQLLKDTAVDRGASGPDNEYGAGRVDAYAAVLSALEDAGTPADLTSITPVVGTRISGNLASIQTSDDVRYRIRSGFGRTLLDLHLVQIEVGANTSVGNPSTLDIAVESRLNQPAGVVRVLLRDRSTNDFVGIGSAAVGNSDATVVFSGVPAADYVGEAGEIDLALKYVVFSPIFAFEFDAFIDFVEILVD